MPVVVPTETTPAPSNDLLLDFPELQEVIDKRAIAERLIAVGLALAANREDLRVGLREEDVRRDLLVDRGRLLAGEQTDRLIQLVVGVPLLVRTGVTDEGAARGDVLDLGEPTAPGGHPHAGVRR